jgi:hypothetical protein
MNFFFQEKCNFYLEQIKITGNILKICNFEYQISNVHLKIKYRTSNPKL